MRIGDSEFVSGLFHTNRCLSPPKPQEAVSVPIDVSYPQRTQHGCGRQRGAVLRISTSHAHPLQQPAGIRDGDGTEQPCPGGRDRLPVRPERRCCIAGTARHSPALPWGRPAESPAGSPALPCSALLLPQEPPARTHGGERSPVVRHASRRAEVIRNDRDPFHNSCNAVVTQPAVVMP